MECRAVPYEGEKPFLFINYCRKDAAVVYPMIEKLAMAGCRLWYDDGIAPGTMWPEIIALHLERSRAILAFISAEAVNSHNCCNELIMGFEKRKALFPVLYRDVKLTPGFQLLLGSTERIAYAEDMFEAFLAKLRTSDTFNECLGEAQPFKPEQSAEDQPGQCVIGGEQKITEPLSPPAAPPKVDPAFKDEQEEEEDPYDLLEATIADTEDILGATIYQDTRIQPLLLHLQTGQCFTCEQKTVIGRDMGCSVILKNRKVSHRHCCLEVEEEMYSVADMKSTNGTSIFNRRLSESPEKFDAPVILQLGQTDGETFLVAVGDMAKKLKTLQDAYLLVSYETNEVKLLEQFPFKLGRNRPWPGGALSSQYIGREHASIALNEDGECVLVDHQSRNGTYLNNEKDRLPAETPRLLSNGDVIHLGSATGEYLKFFHVKIDRK